MPSLAEITRDAITPALALLPQQMDSREARLALLAIGLQESKFQHRWQVIDANNPSRKGPARGFWQFERGTRASRGGVWGVFLHPSSRYWLKVLCDARRVEFRPQAIWAAIEQDDVLAAGLARLLLFTDPQRLPAAGDADGLWKLYRYRTWRPGKPHPETWPANYRAAEAATRADACERPA